MEFKKIIPCLDIRDGKVVKGINFEGIKEVGDPVELAKKYSDDGADELTLLDITATNEKRKTILDIIEKVAAVIKIPLAVGGGVRSVEDAGDILNAGASKVGMSSAAVKNKNLIAETAAKFGSEAVVVAIDYQKQPDGKFAVYTTSVVKVNTGMDALEWAIEAERLGAGGLLPTSIDTDGAKNGYDIEFLELLSKAVKIPVTASGGCGKIEDFYELFTKTNVRSALAASVFHFGQLNVSEVKRYLAGKNINVRL